MGGPYAPHTAAAGGLPTVSVDVPIMAGFLACYIAGAVANMTIFQINNRRGHKFIPSGALFGFCMARIMTSILRIVWATRPHNIRIAIAAQVFVNAGILIVYILNLIFAQRILRALQPRIGWSSPFRIFIRSVFVIIGCALAMVIIASVLSIYTLNVHTLHKTRAILLAASTFLLVVTVIPVIILAIAHILPNHPDREHFGRGSMRRKSLILLCSACLCILISGFKCGSNWMPARPINHPAWYQSKMAFYYFGFIPEILILLLLVPNRFDRLFHVPNGSHKAGDYTHLAYTTADHDKSTRSSVENEQKEKV